MKRGPKTKYSPELIRKAKKMYSTGKYSLESIAEYLGFSHAKMVQYHVVPGEKKRHAKQVRDWMSRNLKKVKRDQSLYAKNVWFPRVKNDPVRYKKYLAYQKKRYHIQMARLKKDPEKYEAFRVKERAKARKFYWKNR